MRKAIEGWHVFCLSIDAVRRAAGMGCLGEDEHLSPTGDNLRHVARRLWEEHPERFARILDAMKIHVPELCSIIPHKTQDGRELLQFGFGPGKDFWDSRVSRGTLALLAHLVLFGSPLPILFCAWIARRVISIRGFWQSLWKIFVRMPTGEDRF